MIVILPGEKLMSRRSHRSQEAKFQPTGESIVWDDVPRATGREKQILKIDDRDVREQEAVVVGSSLRVNG